MTRVLYTAVMLLFCATHLHADTPFAYSCLTETDDAFLVSLSVDSQTGSITYEVDGEPTYTYVHWREVGTATILQNDMTGHVEFIFDGKSRTGSVRYVEGWIPHLDGNSLGVEVRCNFGGVLLLE